MAQATKAPPKPKVMTPHKFLAIAFGTAASESGFTVEPRHIVNSGVALYEGYLESVERIMANPSILEKLERFDFLPD
jgi:hypothetical protein